KSYTDFFPALSAKYDLDQNWVIRASRSSTIARPGFNQLNANTQVDTSGYAVVTGNPNLNPTKAASYDISIEHYMGSAGVISVGGFYKKLSDYIVSDVSFLNNTNPLVSGFGFTGSKPILYQSFTNVSNAYAQGVELSYEERFKKLPGYFAGLGVSGNYTYVKSKFDIRPGESHTLPSTARGTYNASVFYELNPVSVRLSLSHVDKYLSGIGPDSTQDLYTDAVNWLDLGAQYQITKEFAVYFNVKNLLNAPIRYTQGTTNRAIQREFYGQTYQAGMTFSF
ncbi:MAG TPA: TonB-dependent receptor, partial [Opitutaceae bacterium]|nr:TonB-dependent receptor [Opitutaceae bacterium]